jgi:hypothetical protein
VAAVKLFVIDAIRKIDEAVGVASWSRRSVPIPREWISSPPRMTP